MSMIAAVTVIGVVRRVDRLYRGPTWVERGSFEALVWDPSALHEAMKRTKRNPVVAMLAKREGE